MSSTTETATETSPIAYPYFSEEHNIFRETVKQFVQTEIAPHAEEWDEAGIFPKELFKKAADIGLFGIRLDPAYGGSGLDWWYTAAYLEGFSYSNGGGSDVAALKTKARIDRDDLVISGQKLWITNGVRSDFIILAVRTDEDRYK